MLRMDQSHNLQNRRSRRSPVLLTATLEKSGQAVEVRLRNFSSDGALVEADVIPPVGSFVLFRRKSTVVGGTIAWVNGRLGGMRFERSLEPEEMLRHVPKPKASDLPAESFKRPSLVNHKLTASERQWIQRWVEDPSSNKLGE